MTATVESTDRPIDRSTDQNGDEAASEEQSPFSKLLDYGRERGYKLDWLQKRDTWGNELDSGPYGLQLGDVDQGIFGAVPEYSENMTGRPRGAISRSSTPQIGNYSIRTKGDVWLRNAADLYDEPIHKNFADDGFAADKFFRYNPSLQQFMDNSRELEASFTLEGATA